MNPHLFRDEGIERVVEQLGHVEVVVDDDSVGEVAAYSGGVRLAQVAADLLYPLGVPLCSRSQSFSLSMVFESFPSHMNMILLFWSETTVM